jgi:WD40 repeat protein/tRNA A-37 threonylcarbamoyl transferase component Bud32
LNLGCAQPQNLEDAEVCRACGAPLRLHQRYRCLSLLGQGGFGRTYLAVDERSDPPVQCVVKQIAPSRLAFQGLSNRSDLDRAEVHQRFQLEARQLAILGKHPQIPQLLAVVESDQGQFLVQEYVPGPNLDQLAQQHPVDEALVRRVLDEILPVLQFIHNHRVIHRDVKPANIIAPDTPQLLSLVDFGASKYVYEQALLEKTGTVIGSAGYVAPEQALGKAVFASDIFSLGVTCLHLLTGQHPFDLYSVSDDAWTWETFVQSPVSKRLARVLNRMVRRRLKERYQSAGDVIADLRWTASPHPRTTPNPTLFAQAKRTAQTGSAKEVWDLRATVGIPGTVENAVSISPSGRMVATASSDGTIRLWDCTNGELLQNLSKPLGMFGVGHRGEATAVVFNSDGKALFSSGEDGQLIRWDLDDYSHHQSLKLPVWTATSLLMLPDQILAIGAGDGQIHLWSLAGKPAAIDLIHHQDRVNVLTLDVKAQQLISGSNDQTIRIWSLPSGRLSQTLTAPNASITALTCHPQDGRIISGDSRGQVQVWNRQRPEVGLLLAKAPSAITAAVISPDGHWLAAGFEDGTLPLWDLQNQIRLDGLRHDWAVRSLTFTPDSRMLVSTGADETMRFWCLLERGRGSLGRRVQV